MPILPSKKKVNLLPNSKDFGLTLPVTTKKDQGTFYFSEPDHHEVHYRIPEEIPYLYALCKLAEQSQLLVVVPIDSRTAKNPVLDQYASRFSMLCAPLKFEWAMRIVKECAPDFLDTTMHAFIKRETPVFKDKAAYEDYWTWVEQKAMEPPAVQSLIPLPVLAKEPFTVREYCGRFIILPNETRRSPGQLSRPD